jgi:glycosyltransferase involved in cell wall biosynthesis
MKFLFCSHNPLDPRLGAAKALIETAAALEKLGHTCTLVSDETISPGIRSYSGVEKIRNFSESLARYLDQHAKDYDVVEYEHLYLPYSRSRFSDKPLFVARSVLLTHHFEKIILPRYHRLRSWVGHWVKGPARARELNFSINVANETFKNCDLIKVNNSHDQIELVSRGFSADKIAVIPDGMSIERMTRFHQIPTQPNPPSPKIAFVGTFDLRKGAREFPEIVRQTIKILPGCKFKLLGARYLSAATVLQFFPKTLHRHLEIIPEFSPDSLPQLLQDCSIGIFPSYIEGFGLGVLEMLAASLPVIAYDAPGPPMMLPANYLVTRGDCRSLVTKATDLLKNPSELSLSREWAKARSNDFTWEATAKAIVERYSECARIKSAHL